MSFDDTPDRRNSYSFKWQKYSGKDVLPAWLADTEFKCAPAILEALGAKLNEGNLGYVLPSQYTPAIEAVQRWLADKHDWQVERDWIVWMPGVVPAFNVACKAYCEPGNKVLIQTPNYPPLLAAPKLNGLERVDIPTVSVNGRPILDFEVLEREAADPACTLMILCNPMNPVGTVLRDHELARVIEICNANGVMLCSDEIHCDLILEPGLAHIPAGRKSDKAITLMAASKTFNIAGLGAAFAIIPDEKQRRRFTRAAAGTVPWVNVMGLIATEAAFTLCDDWHQGEIAYLRDNRDLLVSRINAIDGLQVHKPEATFLAWVDASGLGVSNVQQWAEEKGVGPSPGIDFHARDHFRLNFGCSRDMLEAILARLEK